MSRSTEKITEIRKFVRDLDSIKPDTYQEYASNLEKRQACERSVEKIMEATTDLAFLLIKASNFRTPEDDADAFAILAEKKLISTHLAEKLKAAKGMKNVIAHQYANIDNEIIFEAINKELSKGVKAFLKSIEKT